jgi:phospholipase/carboxylesterase
MAGRPSQRRSSPAAVAPAGSPLAIPGCRLFMPQGYEPGYDYPLLVWLADDAGFDLGRVMARTSLRNFVAVQPDGAEACADRDEAVWSAIDAARDRASVHAGRIFLVGRRSAGTEAFRIACRHPDAFGGVISIGGGFPLDESAFARLRQIRRLPMLLCQRAGDAFAAAPQTDRTLRLFHAAGAMLAMRIYPGGRDLSRAVLADVNRWIMDEICGAAPALQSECAR